MLVLTLNSGGYLQMLISKLYILTDVMQIYIIGIHIAITEATFCQYRYHKKTPIPIL